MFRLLTLASVVGIAAAEQCVVLSCPAGDGIRAQKVSKQPASFDSPTYHATLKKIL